MNARAQNREEYTLKDFTGTIINGGNARVSSHGTSEVKTLPEDKQAILNALSYLTKIEDDWDGYGGISPTPQALQAAKSIVEHFPINRRCPDTVSPEGEGSVLFIWKDQMTRTIFTIEACLIHISVEHHDGRIVLPPCVAYDLSDIPREVLPFIPMREPNRARTNP
jgi:hypothetical protein